MPLAGELKTNKQGITERGGNQNEYSNSTEKATWSIAPDQDLLDLVAGRA